MLNRHRRLGVELLEDRAMLAGNVLASLAGGTFTITGDNFANQISVQQLSATEIRIEGLLDITGQVTTKVNGSLAGVTLTYAGGALNLSMNMKAGSDEVNIGFHPVEI